MNPEPKIKTLFSLKDCKPCELAKELLREQIASGEITVEEIGDVSNKSELDKAMLFAKRGIIAFPTLQTDNGRFCLIKKINEDSLELECGEEPGKYPKMD